MIRIILLSIPCVLIFVGFEIQAGQCNPDTNQPCTIALENTLPSGKTYKLEIIEALLPVENSSSDDFTGYWGASGAYPATYINQLSLDVDQAKIKLPAKAYSDLGNISAAEVKENQFGIVLIVRGGDAAGSYYATFVFVDNRIRKRTVRADARPDQLWEKTSFSEP